MSLQQERAIIEQENKVFQDAYMKGKISKAQYEQAMAIQRERLADATVSATEPSRYTTEYLESQRFYEKAGYPQYGGVYAPVAVPEGYKVYSVKESDSGLQFMFVPETSKQTTYTRKEAQTNIERLIAEKQAEPKEFLGTPTQRLTSVMVKEMGPSEVFLGKVGVAVESFASRTAAKAVDPANYATPIMGIPLTPEAIVKQRQNIELMRKDPVGYIGGKLLTMGGVIAFVVNPASAFVSAGVGAGIYTGASAVITGEIPDIEEIGKSGIQTAGFVFGTSLLLKGAAAVPKVGKYASTVWGKSAVMGGVGGSVGYFESEGNVEEALKMAAFVGGLTFGIELLPKGVGYVKSKIKSVQPVVTGWERTGFGPEGYSFKEYKGVLGKSQIPEMPSFIREERMSQFLVQTSQASSKPVSVTSIEQTVYGTGGKPYIAILKHTPNIEGGGLVILKEPLELQRLALLKGSMLKFKIAPALMAAYKEPTLTQKMLSQLGFVVGSSAVFASTKKASKLFSVPSVSEFVSTKKLQASKLSFELSSKVEQVSVQVPASAQIAEQITGQLTQQVTQQRQKQIQKVKFPTYKVPEMSLPSAFFGSSRRGGGKGRKSKGLGVEWFPRRHKVKTWQQQLKTFGIKVPKGLSSLGSAESPREVAEVFGGFVSKIKKGGSKKRGKGRRKKRKS